MTGPRISPGLDALLRLLRRAAETGRQLPTTTGMAAELGLSGAWTVTGLLRAGEKLGLIRVHHTGRGIGAIEAADGSWRAVGSAGEVAAQLPHRRCLRCRGQFQPRHRHNFLCTPCGSYADREG
jgi:hypothetical protein